MRSSWKVYTPLSSILEKDKSLTFPGKTKIDKSVVGTRLHVYNGHKDVSFIVRPYMVENRVSSIFSSKFTGRGIHVKRKKKKKKLSYEN